MFCGKHILEQVEELGKSVALSANPNHWACEDRDRAASYLPMLTALHSAYAQLKNNVDWFRVLPGLRTVIVTGVERNKLERIIEQCNHDDRQDNR